MKNAKILLFAITLLFSINSCKKKGTGFTGGTWSATVNGMQQSGYALITYTSSVNELSVALFPSASALTPSMTVTTGIQDSVAIVSGMHYPLNGLLSEAFYSPGSDSSDLISNQGQLDIKQINFKGATANGIFNFSCPPATFTGDSVIVSNGVFSGEMEEF